MTKLRADRLESLYDELHAEVYEEEKDHSVSLLSDHLLLLRRWQVLEQGMRRSMSQAKLQVERSPRTALGLACLSLVLLTMPGQGPSEQMIRNERHAMVTGDYSSLEVDYNFRMGDIDPQHWCLFGTDNQCSCEDPTHGESRDQYPGWVQPHQKNVEMLQGITHQINLKTHPVDVVFFGDETVQSWDGMWFNQRCPHYKEIMGHWNRTFGMQLPNPIRSIKLGLSGDRITHLLYRLQHGEMPPRSLNAKVIWLVLGSRDLAVSLCSEEVVTLGIMRIAEEIKHYNPQATVVIQSILPRTHHKDGSLDHPDNRPLKHQGLLLDDNKHHGQHLDDNADMPDDKINQQYKLTSEFSQADEGLEALEEDEERRLHAAEPKYDYYLWPSIQKINTEVRNFCESHSGFEFFDATPLFLTSKGNDRNHIVIRRELLREYAQLSADGHGVLLDAIQKKLRDLLKR